MRFNSRVCLAVAALGIGCAQSPVGSELIGSVVPAPSKQSRVAVFWVLEELNSTWGGGEQWRRPTFPFLGDASGSCGFHNEGSSEGQRLRTLEGQSVNVEADGSFRMVLEAPPVDAKHVLFNTRTGWAIQVYAGYLGAYLDSSGDGKFQPSGVGVENETMSVSSLESGTYLYFADKASGSLPAGFSVRESDLEWRPLDQGFKVEMPASDTDLGLSLESCSSWTVSEHFGTQTEPEGATQGPCFSNMGYGWRKRTKKGPCQFDTLAGADCSSPLRCQ